jgi:hypothetical protein
VAEDRDGLALDSLIGTSTPTAAVGARTAISPVGSDRVDPDVIVAAGFPLDRAAEALDSDLAPGTVKSVVTVS